MARSPAKKTAKKQDVQSVDPRFAAFARLLTRNAVRKELAKESAVSHDSDSHPKDQS